jgi:hypothetical protein
MSITLDIPQELESELSAEAARLKLPLPEYVLRILSAGRTIGKTPKTGEELVAYWQSEGIIGSRPDIIDSQVHARNLRHEAETRRHS